MSIVKKKPQFNEAEITLLGTGGYGEAIIIHLGNDEWIIVDSCIDPGTKVPLTIDYLNEMGVDIANNVKLIICTHWHDDHILGISKALEACKSAKFAFSKAHDRKKFLRFISFDYEKRNFQVSNSSTLEFNKSLNIIQERNSTIISAIADRLLYNQNFSNNLTCQIISLSPSDFTIEKFDKEISTLITEFGSASKKIIINGPNAKSVALYIKLGEHRAILGADLEVSTDNREGWISILENNQVIDKPASLFKIPHHGSKNGYHERIWEELLMNNPVSELTTYNKNAGLPEAKMLKKFCDHSDFVYMTNNTINNKPKSRDKQIEKIIKKMDRKLVEIKYNKGIIQCRIMIDQPDALWKIELIENSLHVNSIVSKL